MSSFGNVWYSFIEQKLMNEVDSLRHQYAQLYKDYQTLKNDFELYINNVQTAEEKEIENLQIKIVELEKTASYQVAVYWRDKYKDLEQVIDKLLAIINEQKYKTNT